jgi:hypothetical protein
VVEEEMKEVVVEEVVEEEMECLTGILV